MTGRIIVFVIVCAICLPGFADENRRDGNWWRDRTNFQRTEYVVGFFDGMELGSRFSYWNLETFKANKNDPIAGQVLASYATLKDRYFKELTNGQITDGLNAFYNDYRNRTIMLYDAVWLVVNMIAGESDTKMQSLIESFRKNVVK
jgi:hypothetical protein